MGQTQDSKLGTEKIGKLMFSMALPAVAAQVINVLYNIVDRMYIGHMPGNGNQALTGVGVAFPIIILISAFSAFAGMGGAPLASISLGKQDKEEAEGILGSSTFLLIFFAVVLTVVFFIFKKPFLYAFGASDSVIGYALDYISIYLCGTIFVELAIGLNTFISAQGNAKMAMFSVVIGAVINIILDPIFIFVFGMGVKGAALASVIAQAVSAIWVVSFLCSKKSVIRIQKKYLKFDRKKVAAILGLGISPFIMQSTESLVNIVLNTGLQKYGGDLYVGSMTVLTSVMQLIVVPIQGVTQGVQPIISYNFGAGNKRRVVEAFRKMAAVTFGATMIMGGSTLLFPKMYARIFTDNGELITLIVKVMPVFFLGTCVFGLQLACQATFLALGQAKISLIMALLRKVVLLIPLALLMPRFMGVMGIYRAEPIADVLATIITLTAFLVTHKKILERGPKKA